MRKDVRGTRWRRPQGRGSLLIALGLLMLLLPVVARAQTDTVTVSWTAPGDDGNAGTATAYEIRMSLAPIDDTNWNAASIVVSDAPPVPRVAGTRQRSVVRGLTRGTSYWFAIKAVDDAGNWAPISNVVRWDWVLDTAPPAAPTGVSAAKQVDSSVRVNWSANGEPDLLGYNVYRSLSASGPFTQQNTGLVTSTQYIDGTIPDATTQVWYQLSAMDGSGNESARSATVTVVLSTGSSPAANLWALETGYPNPSPSGATVHIPVTAPASGGSAALEIVNSGGQRVLRRDLGSLAPGATEILWDGRNQAGRAVGPGVYTAWLISGSTRISVRLVRVP